MLRFWNIAISLIAILWAVNGSLAAEPTAMKQVEIEQEIFISIPESVVMSTHSPVHDFLLVDFELDGKFFLRLYLGNHPQFPFGSCSSKPEREVRVGKVPAMIIECDARNHLKEELLISVRPKSWPAVIHAMVPRTNTNMERLARDIVGSIRVNNS